MECANSIRVWKGSSNGRRNETLYTGNLGSEARWTQFGETELATGELFIYSGNENKDDVHERGVGIMLLGHVKEMLDGMGTDI